MGAIAENMSQQLGYELLLLMPQRQREGTCFTGLAPTMYMLSEGPLPKPYNSREHVRQLLRLTIDAPLDVPPCCPSLLALVSRQGVSRCPARL